MSQTPTLSGERAVGAALVFAGYCAAQGLSTLLRCPPINVSPLWLPLGFVAGVFVATDMRSWPIWWASILAASLVANALMGLPFAASIWVGLFLPVAAGITAWVVRRQPLGREEGNELNLRRLIALVLAGSVIFGILCILPAGLLGWRVGFELDYATFFERQAVNLPLNMILVTPVVATLILRVRSRRWPERWTEPVLLGLALFLASWLAFWLNDGNGNLDCLVYLPLPALLWLAIRHGTGGTAAGMLLVACVAFFTAAHRTGPFAHLSAAPRVLAVQLSALALGLPVVFLASAVAEREKARQRSQRNDRLFRAFVENAPVPIILSPSPDDGKLYLNPALTRLLGYTRDDLQSAEDWWPRVYPDPAHRAERRKQWDSVVDKVEKSGEFEDLGEAEMLGKNKELRHMQARLAMVQGHKLIFLSDLTARRKAETQLQLTQYAVDHNPAMIYRIDTSGRFVYANEAACRQMGYTLAELLSRPLWDVAATVSKEGWELRMAALKEQGSMSLESVFARKDGSTFPVEVQTYYMEYGGEGTFFTFAFDITARRQAQEAVQKHLKQIEQLAAELTRSEEQQRRDFAAMLHDGIGQNLFAATAQLLALKDSRNGVEAGIEKAVGILDRIAQDTRNLTFELCPPVLYQMGLGPALQRLVDQFASKHGIACTLEGGGTGPEDLNIRGLAYQAVRELLNNVAKHARARHVTVRVEQRDEAVDVTVADDGGGFDEEQSAAPSAGFGLFRLRERIELLGGTFAIASEPGHGFKAGFSLPMQAGTGR